MILRVDVQGGVGGIACADITAILPDVNNPEDSVVYTTVFTTGLSVKGDAETLCATWFAWFTVDDEEEEDDA